MKNVLAALGINRVDGILLDIGVSSHQLDDADERLHATRMMMHRLI